MMKSLFIDLLKTVYALYVKTISRMYTKAEKKKQVVYLLSFPNNDHGLIESLNKQEHLSICYTKQVSHEALAYAEKGIDTWCINTVQGLFMTIKLITESKIVIADNYFPLLGDIVVDSRREIIQLWHATGAIKRFGLEEKSAANRTKTDHDRFNRVYQSFTRFLVGSKAMGDVFKKSYGATEEEILYLGFPRTDYLLKASKEEQQTQKIVYLPTYRKNNMPNLVADVLFLREKLPATTELIIKIHPATTLLEAEKLTAVKGVRLVQQNQGADDLLLAADCLITDYSSVAFDYALISKQGKLVFYWFDEEEYEKETGIQQIFKETLPYKVVSTIEEVALSIEESQDDLSAFNEVWNTYNDGESTKRLLQWIKEKMDGN